MSPIARPGLAASEDREAKRERRAIEGGTVKGIAVLLGLLLCSLPIGAAAEQGGAPVKPGEAGNSRVAAKPKGSLKSGAAAAKPGPADAKAKVADDLDAFCKKWMGFLAVREYDNRAKVAWKPAGDGVEAEFVGYGTDYICAMKENPDPKAVPVATIKYREFLYRQRGSSAEDAKVTAPDVLEATEVTEIFRYAKGEWVY
jgi:hypothetical protein